MKFVITSAGNNSTFGDVFFGVPTKEEIKKAEKTVSDICYETSYEKLPCVLAFAEELKQATPCSFEQLLRLYAYQKGSFQQAKSVKKLSDPCFFVTKNEFFRALTYYNIQDTVALDVVKMGVWSRGNKRKNYIKILKSYNVPERICEYFSDVTNLWEANDFAIAI